MPVLKLFDFVLVVRPVRIAREQESEFRMILLAEHALLELGTAFGDELGGLVYDAADVRRWEDETNALVLFRHCSFLWLVLRAIKKARADRAWA